MKDIGKKIRTLREERGMTQEELAHKVGYKSRVSINKIELQRDIPINKVVPIAKALGVDPAMLLGWDNEPISMETSEERHQELLIKYVESVFLANEMRPYIDKLKELPIHYREVVYKTIDSMYELSKGDKDEH